MRGPEGGRRRVLPVRLGSPDSSAGAVLSWAVVGPDGDPAEVDVAARLHRLAEPVAGYGAVVAPVEALLEDSGEDPASTGGVWASPPEEGGRVTGHVAEPSRLDDDLPEVRYRVHGDAEHLRLTTTADDEVACSGSR